MQAIPEYTHTRYTGPPMVDHDEELGCVERRFELLRKTARI